MRLLLISRAHSAASGGMERLSFELISELQKLPELEVITLFHSGTPLRSSSFAGQAGRLGAVLFVLESIPQALWLARRVDAVHVGDPVLALHGWLIKKILGKPVAVTVHGLDVTYANPLYQLYLRLFGQFDMCLPISAHAETLLKQSPVRSRGTQIITPGAADRYFDPTISRDQLATLIKRITGYQLQPEQEVLLTVGRLVKRKGHAWFIENVLPHLDGNTIYLIAGDGSERESLEAAAAKSPQKVLLLGRVSDDDLKILYNAVTAFVQPNIVIAGDAEGFGIVLLEAALCQRPVFASRLDGIPGAIHDGKNGTLLPAVNATAWVAALSVPLKPNLAAREYTLQNFDWAAQARAYADALRALTH